MATLYKKQYQKIKFTLGIKNIISICFSDTKSKKYKKYRDTVCTALTRSLKKNILTYIDRKEGQLCFGGNYFLNIVHATKNELCKIYVKDEKIFQNKKASEAFLNILPKYPSLIKKKYILLTPLAKENNKPEIIMFLATPAQAGRILGLSVYKKMSCPIIIPALSTCASIYTPLIYNKIHINFIDYYDRYYQGKQNKKLLWDDNQLIISLPYNIFKQIIEYIPLSSHGTYRPKIKPQKVDLFH